MKTRLYVRQGVSLLATAVISLPLSSAPADDPVYRLEEVVVTARKRQEGLQDTPVSVTAFRAADIEARSLSNLGDITAFTPNVEINNGRGDSGSTNASIFIRGVGQNDFIFPTDPGVGLYIDGVYVARSIGGMMDLADIERIEVLRGPQGTLYGKNTIGGAVNVISTRPGVEPGGKIELTVGDDQRADLVGRVNFPLVPDRLFGKLAFATKNQDGYVERVDGVDLGDKGVNVFRGALRWIVTDRVEANLSVDYSEIDQNGTAGSYLGAFPASAQALYNGVAAPYVSALRMLPPGSVIDDRWITDDVFRSNGTGETHDRNDSGGVHLAFDWEINDAVALKSISAYRFMEAEIAVDMDHTPFPIVETLQDQEQDQFSQEFQLSGVAFEGKMNWLAGAYFFTEDAEDINHTRLASGIYDALESLPAALVPLFPPGAPASCPPGDPANGLFCAGGQGNPINASLDFDVRPITEIDAETTALFAHLTYDVTNQLSLTLGGRYTWEDKKYFIDSIYPNSGGVAMPPTDDSQSWSEFTPKFGVDFDLTEAIMLYASYSEGFKSGGWNPRVLSPEEYARYDQEFLSTWEVGVKSTWWDNRMTLNFAAFSSDYEDLQLVSNVVSPTTGGLLLIVQNAGEVSIEGAELELVARPARGWDLQLGIGYLDTGYDQLDDSITWDINNVLPDAPEWTINAAVQYRVPLAEYGNLTLRLDGAWKDKTYKDPFNIEAIAQDSYPLVNGRIAWESAQQEWHVALFLLNATDEEYITSATSVAAFGINTANYGHPRQWGLTVGYRF